VTGAGADARGRPSTARRTMTCRACGDCASGPAPMAGSSPARICSARKISTTQNSAHAAAATVKPTFRESESRRSVTVITAPVIGPVVAITTPTAVVVEAVVVDAVVAATTAVVVKAVVIAAVIAPVVAIATATAVVSLAAAASAAAVVVFVAHNGQRRGRGVTRANDRGANLALA
jgi:hypothetical protein